MKKDDEKSKNMTIEGSPETTITIYKMLVGSEDINSIVCAEIYSKRILNLLKTHNKTYDTLIFDSDENEDNSWFSSGRILVKDKIGKAYSNYIKIYLDAYPNDYVTIELLNF